MSAVAWDREFPYSLEGLVDAVREQDIQTLDISVVRAPSLEQASLGNLYWPAVAAFVQQQTGVSVNVYDYQNHNPQDDPQITRNILDILGLNATVHLEEGTVHDPAIMEYLAAHADELQNHWKFSQVKEGIAALQQGEYTLAQQQLHRLCNEVTLFTQGADDPHRALLYFHEVENTGLIKMMGTPSKQFWRVDLSPATNEYRGNLATVGDLDGAQFQNKLFALYQTVLKLTASVFHGIDSDPTSIVERTRRLGDDFVVPVAMGLHHHDPETAAKVLYANQDKAYEFLKSFEGEQTTTSRRKKAIQPGARYMANGLHVQLVNMFNHVLMPEDSQESMVDYFENRWRVLTRARVHRNSIAGNKADVRWLEDHLPPKEFEEHETNYRSYYCNTRQELISQLFDRQPHTESINCEVYLIDMDHVDTESLIRATMLGQRLDGPAYFVCRQEIAQKYNAEGFSVVAYDIDQLNDAPDTCAILTVNDLQQRKPSGWRYLSSATVNLRDRYANMDQVVRSLREEL